MPHTVPYIVDDALERSNEVDFSNFNIGSKITHIGRATVTVSIRLSSEIVSTSESSTKFWILKVHSNEKIFLHLYIRFGEYHYIGPFPVRLKQNSYQEIPLPVPEDIEEFMSVKLVNESW
jgi:hypothetical protein